MRTLALTILTMGIALAAGPALAQTSAIRQVRSTSPVTAETGPESWCLQGCQGLSRQLPILQLRPMHGHRERYGRPLRDQSPVRGSRASDAAPIGADTERQRGKFRSSQVAV